MQEMPAITKSMYASSSADGAALLMGQAMPLAAQALSQDRGLRLGDIFGQVHQQPALEARKEIIVSARIVKVYIADPNLNLPLEKRVLHSGEEKLTDLTDQELFFEVPIAELLKKHNEYRRTVVDKAQAEKFGRDIFLEEARIRDLRMVVVDIAKF